MAASYLLGGGKPGIAPYGRNEGIDVTPTTLYGETTPRVSDRLFFEISIVLNSSSLPRNLSISFVA